MPKECLLSDYVSVTPRYLRSVNLSLDWDESQSTTGYILTPNVVHALDQIFAGIINHQGQRSFALIGPYGTGKSAFTVFLCQLLQQNQDVAEKASRLVNVDSPKLCQQLSQARCGSGKQIGFLPVVVTARRRPISQLILESISQAIEELNSTPSVQKLKRQNRTAIKIESWRDTATVLQLLEKLGQEAKKQSYKGVLIVIDEAGKTLEYALQDREGGDVYVFQEIAEYANRQHELSVIFLITLHQMFDDYVELAERTVRAEWTKVQERFQPIQFSESAATTIQMLAKAFRLNLPYPESVTDAIEQAVNKIRQSGVPLPVGLDYDTFHKAAVKAWPLHPTTLLALPYLFRRLAQNERSVFSYLNSYEPFAFQEHLNQPLNGDAGFIRLHELYSYLISNFEASLARLPHAKRLLEANDVINTRYNLTDRQYELIRSIAILNVLGEMSTLRAKTSLIECVVSNDGDISQEIDKLRQQSILNYRQLDDSYRIWEGSDVDIEERMKEARRHIKMAGGTFLEMLHKYLPEKKLVARRHNLETGAYRFFKVKFCEQVGSSDYSKQYVAEKGMAGIVLVLLPYSDGVISSEDIKRLSAKDERLIVALPKQIEFLRVVVEELVCLRWVEENTEELRDDKVARRELSLRLVEAEQKINQLMQTLLDPRPAPLGNLCQWFWRGTVRDVRNTVDITRLISTACDAIFSKSPKIKNELVARVNISTAAAAARRTLLERMLCYSQQEKLGITGFPPERSIYESILHSSGLHYFDTKKAEWSFRAPEENNPINLKPTWDFLGNSIFNKDLSYVEIRDVFNNLAMPPFGLPDGVHPVLFTAFYQVNQEELFLYREGTFIPDPQIAHFELLQRRPDLFSVKGIRLQGARKEVISRLAKGLGVEPKTVSVVRALYRFVSNLPPITMKSSKFSSVYVVPMKDCFNQASSPENLIFVDLPRIFGLPPFSRDDMDPKLIEEFFVILNQCLNELANHAVTVQSTARDTLLIKLGLETGEAGWSELESRASWLGQRINHKILTPFINSIKTGIEENHNPKPALSFISGRPFEHWSDVDVDRFPSLAEGVAYKLNEFWENYGDFPQSLTAAETNQKQLLHRVLKEQICQYKQNMSPIVIKTAIRELLKEIENNELR